MATPKSLSCPQCGAPVVLRTMGQAESVACAHCGSVLDAKDPSLRILQHAREKTREITPLIPLGTRGTLHGDKWEVVGFQQRTITVDGIDYSWREYVLFNPYKGFRYLTEYDGHWNDVATLRTLPEETTKGGRPAAKVLGETFRHFQTATSRSTFVLGEFPWEVRVGDRVEGRDYVAPPRMLSAEVSEGEITWSLATYTPGTTIWKAFGLKGRPPAPRGVYANQPSPHTGSGRMWAAFALLVACLLALAIANSAMALNQRVLDETYGFDPGAGDPPAFVTDTVRLGGRASNVELELSTNLDNSWAFFDFALIDDSTGRAIDFGRDVSYYHGVEDGESWSEGSTNDRALIPSVPPGRYYLRVAPQGNPQGPPVRYELRLTRDVPAASYYFIAFVLFLIPPIWSWIKAASFETSRWSESDYAPSSDDDE
jgi:hypothetical protein